MIQKDGSKGKKKSEPRNTARWNRQKTKCQNLIRGKSAVGGNINLTRDNLLENAEPIKGGNADIYEIISEEAGAFFAGQKSAEATAEVI